MFHRMIRPLAVILLLGCGRAELQGPPQQEPARSPPPPAACVVDSPASGTGSWQCETVRALEVVSVKVTNADGSEPWSSGQPQVSSLLRNSTGQFLNYPGVQVSASLSALRPRFARDSLYGLGGCGEVQLSIQFNGAVPSGTPVTFTAFPVHINGDECPLTHPPASVTVTAP